MTPPPPFRQPRAARPSGAPVMLPEFRTDRLGLFLRPTWGVRPHRPASGWACCSSIWWPARMPSSHVLVDNHRNYNKSDALAKTKTVLARAF